MTDDTPVTENAPSADRAPENAAITGSSTLPQAELNRLTDDIVAGLKTVYDPEIPADIYELGLIYKIDIGDDRAVKIDMTLTSPNCPSAQELPVMAENAVASVPGVRRRQGRNRVGPALGPEPDVGRGPTRVEHVVSCVIEGLRLQIGLDEDCHGHCTTPTPGDEAHRCRRAAHQGHDGARR